MPDSESRSTTAGQGWSGGRHRPAGPAEGADGAEVVLVTIEGGGHTWPGRRPPVWFIGRSTRTVSANELMWEFFTRHPLR